MTFCPNGHQMAGADHYCRWCGAARPAGDYEPAGEFASPKADVGARQARHRSPAIRPYQPVQGYLPQATNALAVASLVLGLLWFYWIGSALAVILGLVSLRQIRHRDEQGKGMAVAAITIGACGLAALVAVGLTALAFTHPTPPNVVVNGY